MACDEALSRFGCTSTVSAIGSRTLHPPRAPRRRCDCDPRIGCPAGVLELVDRPGLGPGARKSVGVRVPPPASLPTPGISAGAQGLRRATRARAAGGPGRCGARRRTRGSSPGRPAPSSSSRAWRAKSTFITGSRRPWAMKTRVPVRLGQVRLPALHGRDEAAEREDAGRRGAVGAEAERVAHHRAHREAAQHRALGADARALPELVVERGELAIGGPEGVGVGIAHARDDVPVVAGPARAE